MTVIEIHGLSALEVELADAIWACDTKEDVQKFIAALPTKFMRARAIGLYHTMLIEAMDAEMELEDLSLAKSVIESMK
jgi:hypothetical protein